MRTFLIGFFLYLSFNTYAADLDCQAHHCMTVIDAGSTRSTLHLYQYDLDKTQTPINIEEKWVKKTKPGLASLDADKVPAYLNELFSAYDQPNAPIYFYATAGMRLLPGTQQQTVYQAVKAWFAQHPNLTLKEAKTITGEEEGTYGWLSANYNVGGLQNPQRQVGVIDMGGASVQISFPVTDSSYIAQKDLKVIQLYGKTHTLFVHSFLGLGQTEVIHQLMDENGCYAQGYVLSNQTNATGDITSCERKHDLILQVHEVAKTVQPVLSKNQVSNWFVMGGLSAFAKSPVFHFQNHAFTPQSLKNEGVSTYCHSSWNQLINDYPNDPFLPTNCLASVYFYELLVRGYGISPEQSIQFSHDTSTDDWTVGVVLTQYPTN